LIRAQPAKLRDHLLSQAVREVLLPEIARKILKGHAYRIAVNLCSITASQRGESNPENGDRSEEDRNPDRGLVL
jgi:hypothetical protein